MTLTKNGQEEEDDFIAPIRGIYLGSVPIGIVTEKRRGRKTEINDNVILSF